MNKHLSRGSPDKDLLVTGVVLLVLIALGWSARLVFDLGEWAFAMLGVLAGVGAGIVYLARTAQPSPRTRESIAVGVAVSPKHSGLQLEPTRVIALTGRSGSNKSRIAEEIKKNHPDWAYSSCGKFVRQEAEKAGIRGDLLETHNFGLSLVEQLGPEGFLNAVLDTADIPNHAETLIIDDIYHPSVFEALKGHWNHLQFVFVDLPESVRRAVLHDDRGLSKEEVDQIEAHPLDRGADELDLQFGPIKVQGAATDAEIPERAEELELALAA